MREKHRAEDIAAGRVKPTAAERTQQMQKSKGATAEAIKDENILEKIQQREQDKEKTTGSSIGTSAGRRPEDARGRLSDFMNAARLSPDADMQRYGMSYGTTALPPQVQQKQVQDAAALNVDQQRQNLNEQLGGVGTTSGTTMKAMPKTSMPDAAAGNVFEELRKAMQGKEIAEKMTLVFETGGNYVADQIKAAFKGAIPPKIEMTGQLGAITVHLAGGKVLEEWSSNFLTTVRGIIQTDIQEALGKDRVGKEDMGTNTSGSRNVTPYQGNMGP